MTSKQNIATHVALVYPSGKIQKNIEDIELRIKALEQEGFMITDLEPVLDSQDGMTSGPVLERAALVSHSLTNRKFDILMAGRGGYGSTALVPFLEYMLPPILPQKTLVGFSDISYLGVYLSLRFSNFRYIHAKNAFSENLFLDDHSEKTVLFDLMKCKNWRHDSCLSEKQTLNSNIDCNDKIKHNTFECHAVNLNQDELTGVCIPMNLSLAESLAATKNISLPKNTILFLEDCNEYVYRLFRKIDSLINSGFMDNVKAVVLGDFAKSLKRNEEEIERNEFVHLIGNKIRKPIIDFPLFGHNKYCFPLVAHSDILIQKINSSLNENNSCVQNTTKINLILTHTITKQKSIQPFRSSMPVIHSIHMCGIGGTGMASVAGLLKNSGYEVSGSDNKIYPPMDKVLSDLQITPDVGFKKENILNRHIDVIIMGNIMSRKTASLQKNEELDEILKDQIPVMSFPSALRKFFLQKSFNIVVSGTHGKTTTSSLFAFLLTGLGENPSFLIGGMPGNFGQGFGLNSRDLFVLEGDEYDSAFFDKGPKFLHYEPSITIINNIEFDHADIYEDIHAIEKEFLNLASLTNQNNGYNIFNWNDRYVQSVATQVKGNGIAFCSRKSLSNTHVLSSNVDKNTECASPFPLWILESFETSSVGITIHLTAPNETQHSVFCAQIFGEHNALNVLSVIAGLHAKYLLNDKSLDHLLNDISKIDNVLKDFKGVKRRFELIGYKSDVAVFEDFAHHPTAVRTTLQAFKDYISLSNKKGRLIVCFDPHNATLRRNVLQDQLAKSFELADMLFLGAVHTDLRIQKTGALDPHAVVNTCGIQAKYFDENLKLLEDLEKTVRPHDTIVFMSSGAFDGIAVKFLDFLEKTGIKES